MTTLVALASLRSQGRHPWQIALSVLGIALGVAVVVGIDLASASSLRGFRLSTEALVGAATHEIRAGSDGLPAALFAELAIAHPQIPMAPVVESAALVVDAAGEPRGGVRTALNLFGIDPFCEAALRPWLGELGESEGSRGGFELLTEPGTGYLAQDTARTLGLSPGDRFRVRVESRYGEIRLLGVLIPDGERARVALENLLVVDVATAQELTARPARLSRIDLALGEGAARVQAEQDLARDLPPGTLLQPAPLRSQGLEQMTSAFQLNLRALSMLALLVGMFLVYNSMTFSVLQRRSLIATLRTLGVTRVEIFRTIGAEALWLGIAGTVAGVALGTLLARGLLTLISRTMNDLYFVLSVREVHLDWGIVAQAVALGVGATLAAAAGPAWEATRERPRLALSASTLEGSWNRLVPRLGLAGIAVLLVALGLFRWPTASLVPSMLGLLAIVIGAALLTPLATIAFARVATPLLGRGMGMLGRYAARGVEAHLSRTSVAIAALAIALSATVGMGVMIDSFRSTFVRWLALSLEADVYASAPTLVSSHNTSSLDPAVVEALGRAPGVEEVTTYRGFEALHGGKPIHAAAISMNPRREEAFEFRDASTEEVWPAWDGQESVIVSESFGYRHGLGRGDDLELATDRGARTFAIAGTYADFASDQGVVLLSRTTYERHYDDRGITSMGIFARPGTDVEALARALRALVPEDQQVLIRSNRALTEASLAVFERTFAITGVLRLLAGAVAFVGVLSALLALELERARELGMLRAQGVTPREVRRLVLAETGLIGAIAGTIALPLGLALALVLVRVINKRSFGWSLELELDPWLFANALGLAVLAALLAGIWPALRMSRSRPALALRGE